MISFLKAKFSLPAVMFLTALGHISSLIFVSSLKNSKSNELISQIATIDSLWLTLIAFSSLGIGQHFSRLIVNSPFPKHLIYEGVVYRLLISSPIVLIGLMFYDSGFFYILIFVPVIAAGSDFAFYALGKPLCGALLTFIRVTLPYLALVMSLPYLSEDEALRWFILYLILFGFLASILGWRLNGLSITKLDRFKFIEHIKPSFILGFSTLLLTNVMNLVIPIMKRLMTDEFIVEFYLYLKLYLIVLGVRRLFVQFYFKKICSDYVDYIKLKLKLRLIALIGGPSFYLADHLGFDFFYNIYGIDDFLYAPFIFCSICMLWFIGAPTRALSQKQDTLYLIGSIAFSVIIFSLVFFVLYFNKGLVFMLTVLGVTEFIIGLFFNLYVKRFQFAN